MFTDGGIHRVAIASNICTFNEREVYFIHYQAAPLPPCPIFPPDFSFTQVPNQPNFFEFFVLNGGPNSILNNSFVLYFGDGDSSLTAYSQHTYVASGSYQVKLLYRNPQGCSREIIKTVIVSTPTSINFIPGENVGIRMHPNPVNNYLYVDGFPSSERWMILEVHNLNGQKIISQNLLSGIRSIGLNVERLAPGFYILTLRPKNGIPVFLKFTKQ